MTLIYGRKACEKERYQCIGFCWIIRKNGYFYTKIPEHVLMRSETNYYRICISRKIVKEHYMEELILDFGWEKNKRKSVRIERKIKFIYF